MVELPINWLADEAVYRRTMSGKQELLSVTSALTATERRFLAVVTGHTPLRTLLDMGIDAPDIGAAIRGLVSRGLIQATDGARDESSLS